MLYWEGKFHQNDTAYNVANGMSYDGTQLDWNTGVKSDKHPFSAASKEVSILGKLFRVRACSGRLLTVHKRTSPCRS